MGLRVRPYTVKAALPFVRLVHRRLPKIQGAMWAVSLVDGPEVVGVALVGWPARMLNGDTLSVLRVAVMEGHKNGCSMLYGAKAPGSSHAGCAVSGCGGRRKRNGNGVR
jgi:hypothetical protein